MKDYQNLTVAVELTPAMGDLAIRNNDTPNQEYVEIINNFTDVVQYNYKTNGLNVTYDQGETQIKMFLDGALFNARFDII